MKSDILAMVLDIVCPCAGNGDPKYSSLMWAKVAHSQRVCKSHNLLFESYTSDVRLVNSDRLWTQVLCSYVSYLSGVLGFKAFWIMMARTVWLLTFSILSDFLVFSQLTESWQYLPADIWLVNNNPSLAQLSSLATRHYSYWETEHFWITPLCTY